MNSLNNIIAIPIAFIIIGMTIYTTKFYGKSWPARQKSPNFLFSEYYTTILPLFLVIKNLKSLIANSSKLGDFAKASAAQPSKNGFVIPHSFFCKKEHLLHILSLH